ncbi:hypothetical protein GS597_11335 [Synechococcales cyanobacterium C]|uniref:Uncharacterized protein n=1 Tax=Petrachloros mirabilis ULC683 TaxID=2781853 RepID=A0A8K2A8G8_9CYAN|nr:hypothetical protein [Petrachloros mirabilis]NCJ07090.1 hypothetical protein [Petrachloros mirabilis ULC683]
MHSAQPQTASLLDKLQSDPAFEHLREQARQGQVETKPSITVSGFLFLRGLLLADPKGFYGTAYVPQKLKQDAKHTAWVVSGSNLVDFVGNWPLFFFAFNTFGTLPALFVSGVINLCLLKMGNDLAAGTARRRAGNRAWSAWATAGLLTLNLVQTIASGVGVELFNNQSQLSQQRAADLIELQQQQVEDLKTPSTPRYDEVKAQCEAGQAQLEALPRTHHRWDSLYVQLYGAFGDQTDWSQEPLETAPICEQAKLSLAQSYKTYETAKAHLEQNLAQRVALGNDVVFIQRFYPAIYDENFDADGYLLSGVEAVQYAFNNFFAHLAKGQVDRIALSLLFFSVSILTSVAACAMTFTFARREDTQQSWDERVRRERDRWLYHQWQLFQAQKENTPHRDLSSSSAMQTAHRNN